MKYFDRVIKELELCHHPNGDWIGYLELRVEFDEEELAKNSSTIRLRNCVRTKLENARIKINSCIDLSIERLG